MVAIYKPPVLSVTEILRVQVLLLPLLFAKSYIGELPGVTAKVWSSAKHHRFKGKVELGQKFLREGLIY